MKNYHDLPPFIRRVFLSDSLADKFPSPIAQVRKLLVACREKTDPPFGKPFGKSDTLSVHELLAGGHSSNGNASGASATVIADAKGPAMTRGVPLTLTMTSSTNAGSTVNSGGLLPPSFPLSPVAALSSAHAQLAKSAQHTAAHSMQSLMALASPSPLSSFSGWNIGVGLGKSLLEREEAPLQPEEEEMLNAILKTPPKASVRPTPAAAPAEDADEEMSVDEKEEEAVREVVVIESDKEEDEEEEDTAQVAPSKQQTKPTVTPRRSLRRMRSISSISSDLTVSESESSAPPPSLDSRPALKGKSTNKPPALTTINGNGRRRRGENNSSVALPARSEPETAKRIKIIEVDEPAELVKPRRSIRTAKADPVEPAPAPPAPRQKTAKAAPAPVPEVKAAPVAKPRRSTFSEKEVEKDGPVLTRAGAAAAQKNAKRTLRSRA